MILQVNVIPYQPLGSDLVSCVIVDDDDSRHTFVIDREDLIGLLFDGGWRHKFQDVLFQQV